MIGQAPKLGVLLGLFWIGTWGIVTKPLRAIGWLPWSPPYAQRAIDRSDEAFGVRRD